MPADASERARRRAHRNLSTQANTSVIGGVASHSDQPPRSAQCRQSLLPSSIQMEIDTRLPSPCEQYHIINSLSPYAATFCSSTGELEHEHSEPSHK
jgi:hypothetical protein